MMPGALGLMVALFAFWSYQYLNGRMETFDLEMENATVQLVNRLIVHLAQLKKSDPDAWSVLARRPMHAGFVAYSETALNENEPNLSLGRMYRHGLLELIWPKFTCDVDKAVILEAASWVCRAYGVAGFLTYWFQHRLLSGLAILCFFLWAGALIRNGQPRTAMAAVMAFFALALVVCYLAPYSYGWWGSFFCVLAVVPFVGGFRAGSSAPVTRELRWRRVAARLVLALLLLGAGTAIVFGNVLGLFEAEPFDHSMEPTIHAGDWVLGENVSTTRQIFIGELLEVNIGGLGSLRVVGVPGDRIQVKSGHLIRNGVTVAEPYIDLYSGSDGDFPLPGNAYSDEILSGYHWRAYGEKLKAGEVYTVPAGSYFLLNDNRRQLSDSRTMGPITPEYLVARLIAAYPRLLMSWAWPRMVR
jgi:signal peptidase I